MNNTLLDNSSASLSMTLALEKYILQPGIDTIRIATGYWDIPGLALVVDELEQFLSNPDHKLKLLIGKDAYVYSSMLKQPIYKDANYPAVTHKCEQEKIDSGMKIIEFDIKEESDAWNLMDCRIAFGIESSVKVTFYNFEKWYGIPDVELFKAKLKPNNQSEFVTIKCTEMDTHDDDTIMETIAASRETCETTIIAEANSRGLGFWTCQLCVSNGFCKKGLIDENGNRSRPMMVMPYHCGQFCLDQRLCDYYLRGKKYFYWINKNYKK